MLINPRLCLPTHPSGGWPLYSAKASAALDREVIAKGTPGFQLMQKAARAAWRLIQQKWPRVTRLSVLCGGGNNGGDGLLVALYAAQEGVQVRLWLLGDPDSYQNEAAQAWAQVQEAGLRPETAPPSAETLQEDELLVDALLGIGLQGPVRGEACTWIAAINAAQTPVLALDTPSGLQVDSGSLASVAVRAQVTLTFIVLKPGLFTAQGPEQAGEVWLADLGVLPEDQTPAPSALLQGAEDRQAALVPRKAGGHKGDHGRLLILAGQAGMGGAAILAAQAALRSGAGMVKLLTAPDHLNAVLAQQPEVMASAWKEGAALQAQLDEAFAWADALLIGPGLGQDEQAQQLWQASQSFTGPVVVDADALNLWAASALQAKAAVRSWVVTPHPGEAARLLGWTGKAVQENRLAAVAELTQKTGSVALLKGAGSCVQEAGSCVQKGTEALPWICPFGNPGMGVAGMGDLLSGCIAALLAQGLTPAQAARLGVRLHAQAGDDAVGDQPRGLLPSDLLPCLRQRVNEKFASIPIC